MLFPRPGLILSEVHTKFLVIANPLYALTYFTACQEAFDRLKMVLTNAPFLAFPDFNRDFLLEKDASGIGLGAVLAQK